MVTEVHYLVQIVFGVVTVSQAQVFEWACHCKEGVMFMKYECPECHGCPSASINNELIAQVHDLVQNYRRLTVHEMAEETGIFCASCWDILTDYLGMRHVSTMFVP
jgi:DnaJ-class molecular chaperone